MLSRFPPLPDRPPYKRGRTEASAHILFKTKESFPKFHVLHSENPEKTIRTMSPFLVAKSLSEAIGPGYKVTKMASGDLLLELCDQAQYGKLSKLTAIGKNPVSVTPHRSLNTVRGVISDADLLELSEGELLEGWKEEHVISVQRITIRRENKEIPTKHLVLTFAMTDLPESIQTGYIKIRVRPYIPNPRRCFQCQRFGHGSQSCRGQLTCAKCAENGHSADDCQGEPRCANCDGEHPAYSRSCPKWKLEKEIISLKVTQNISFKEARQRFSIVKGTSYADAASRGAAPLRQKAAVRVTDSEPTVLPSASLKGAAKAVSPSTKLPATPVVSGSAGNSQRSSDPLSTPSTSGLVGTQASSLVAGHSRKTRSQERVSSVSHEAMDTTPSSMAQSAPKERRGSLDRSRKEKTPITGPNKGPVK